jgi:hypothetical protein
MYTRTEIKMMPIGITKVMAVDSVFLAGLAAVAEAGEALATDLGFSPAAEAGLGDMAAEAPSCIFIKCNQHQKLDRD